MVDQLLLGGFPLGQTGRRDKRDVPVDRVVGKALGAEVAGHGTRTVLKERAGVGGGTLHSPPGCGEF